MWSWKHSELTKRWTQCEVIEHYSTWNGRGIQLVPEEVLELSYRIEGIQHGPFVQIYVSGHKVVGSYKQGIKHGKIVKTDL